MRGVAGVVVLSLSVAACVSPYVTAGLGRINRPVSTVWVGADKFVYVPGGKGYNFEFETAHSGRVIKPGMMYTDGGSIPRLAQIFKGFSPWGFGPAYIVHDWIFYARHCYLDRHLPNQARYRDDTRFADVYGKDGRRPITFDESATILAEVIKTIIDNGQVLPENVPAKVISAAVDSVFALALWNEAGACERQRVEPLDIAIVWVRLNEGRGSVPPTWKLSPWEIAQAKEKLPFARQIVHSLKPLPKRPKPDGRIAQSR